MTLANHSLLKASDAKRCSKTVFPTPRSPVMRIFAGNSGAARSTAPKRWIALSRPASTNGGGPTPGRYGFFAGSWVITIISFLLKHNNISRSFFVISRDYNTFTEFIAQPSDESLPQIFYLPFSDEVRHHRPAPVA